MFNFTDAKDFLPTLPHNKAITVTTEYDRHDPTLPYVSPVVLNRLRDEGKVTLTRQSKGVSLYSVQRK